LGISAGGSNKRHYFLGMGSTQSGAFMESTDNNNIKTNRQARLQKAAEATTNKTQGTTTNFVAVSGIVPSRDKQPYGGLNNFPRFLEDWRDTSNKAVKSNLVGSMIQLTFSSAATAPLDQDGWDYGQKRDAGSFFEYYVQPARRWGFDVGLQYLPPAPISLRFSTPGNIRSEFYRELPVDDDYIGLLRCAKPEGGGDPLDKTCP
jgi:hypothetical protein